LFFETNEPLIPLRVAYRSVRSWQRLGAKPSGQYGEVLNITRRSC